MSRWKIAAVVAVSTLLLCCGGVGGTVGWLWATADRDTVGAIDFVNPLTIPPLAESTVDADGNRVFSLAAQSGRHDFGGRVADTWGFNGGYLGPTLRAKRGERVTVNFRNAISEPTTVHWHGMHLPAAMDGGPHQMVAPNGTWSPSWLIDQPAATLWYHPHPHGATAEHVYRGLAGMFIVDDDAGVRLPAGYGVDDIPVVVQDRNFDGDELDDANPFLTDIGILGGDIIVNGTYAPYLDVTTELVRLRLVNGSNARSYDFGFSDDREFHLVGTDGGLLDRPYPMKRVLLTPGERAEIVVRFAPNDRPVLRSTPPGLGGGAFQDRFVGAHDSFDVLEIRAGATLRPGTPLPATLVDVDLPDEAKATGTRAFRMSGTNINARNMDPGRIDFAVTRGSTEVWEVTNADGAPHNFHIHDVQFRVLGSDIPARKDTVFLPPSTTVRLAVRFDGPTDPDVPYMYHCHLLRHEDNGMMGQFVVVAPGQAPGTPPPGQHHHD